MDITVIGCGRWGSFIAWYLNSIGHTVTLYGRQSSAKYEQLCAARSNGLLELSKSILLTSDLERALKADTVVVSVGAQNLRSLLSEIKSVNPKKHTYVLCMKGIEISTGNRLSEIVTEVVPESSVAVWLGPGHVQDFTSNVPGCMVVDSDDNEVKKRLVQEFSGHLIRFYYGNDMIGNEIGAATKNVIGIAAGMLDGLGISALKGPLTTRGALEISRLIAALGGDARTAYGLCHLGDYSATVFSQYSHNRQFGESFVNNTPYTALAEGYYTVRPIVALGKKLSVQLPICDAVYEVLYNALPATDAIEMLFLRELKNEHI